jgi:signal transduction histidine kinase
MANGCAPWWDGAAMTGNDASATQAVSVETFGAFLARSRTALVERWKQRVLDDPSVPGANRLPDPALTDHIPALVDRLIDRLGALAAEGECEAGGPASGAVALGAAHAQQRVNARYSVSEGMRELAHFRATILELCREGRFAMSAQEAELVHTTLDEIMTASATELDRASLVLYQRAMAFVAHELRNPLSAILLGSARLQSGAFETSGKVLEILARNAALMDRLVGDLLTISKLEAGHFTIRCHDVDARLIVQDCCDQLGTVASARRIDLVAQVPSQALPIACDRDRMTQALGNLVANALKFTPQGGRVDVRLEADAERCTFRVKDTGPGISPREASAIFQPFWQAPQTSTQGTGLGLGIARGIVEAHGGTLAFEPHEGSGAVFAITLPRTQRPSLASGVIQP